MNTLHLDVQTELKRKLENVIAPADQAATLPPECYWRQDWFDYELKAFFHNGWLGAGREDRCKQPDDYHTIKVADVPIILIRDNRNQLHAFANSCRHRGARLLTDSGNCQVIRCPFHRWTYATDGRLLNAPKMDAAKNFKPEDYGLTEIRLQVMDGFIFICFDAETPELNTCLADFSGVHTPWNMSALRTTLRKEFDVACNWKIFLEVFNEYYHLPYIHPDSIANTYLEPDEMDEVKGQFCTQFGLTDGTGALLEEIKHQNLPVMKSLTGRNRRGTRYTWVFPNMTFAAGTEVIWAFEVYPRAPDLTHVGMSICFPQETTDLPEFSQRAEHYYERFDTAMAEDIAALENQQVGLTSPVAQQGRFCAELEPGVASFAKWYAARALESLP